MTELLGRQDCIKSLRQDLVDIQGAVLDIFSRVGPVQFSSWKFPDKLSCDLDMLALLEKYDFVDGEDLFNQHSHIVLLELVIDRLLLLLQSVSAYIGKQMGFQGREHTQQRGCLSVGLVVKNYWSNLVHFANRREISKDTTKKTKAKAFDHYENKKMSSISSLTLHSNSSCSHSSACSSTNSFKFHPHSNEPSMLNHKPASYLKADHHSISCQTIASSLIPCYACHQIQSHLRSTGKALVDLLQNEGLPSSLQPLLEIVEATVELGHMTAGDVAQWANEHLRDMRRMTKHLQDVRGTVQPLKDKLTATELERNRLRSQLEGAQKEFKQEVEKHQANIVQLEFSLRKAQRSMRETEHELQDKQQEQRREILSLEESNTKLKEEATLQQETIQALECEKCVLQEKLQTEKEACCRLQQSVQQQQTQISGTQLLLDKADARYQSACRQQESMQAKQRSLLKRVDALDEECVELQRELEEREEAELSLHNQLRLMSEVKEQLQTQLTQQQDLCAEVQKEKQALETHVDELKKHVAELTEHVRALSERERLLVAFPELNNWPQAQPQSTGDMLLDMKQQMQANSIRMKVLEQENTTLHKCLQKLTQKAQHNVHREAFLRQAWSTPTEKQQSDLAQVQTDLLQSSSAARAGCSNIEVEVKGAESGLQSAKSEDHVSASSLSLQIHPQTIHLDTGSTDAKSHIQSTSLISHCKDFAQRKK